MKRVDRINDDTRGLFRNVDLRGFMYFFITIIYFRMSFRLKVFQHFLSFKILCFTANSENVHRGKKNTFLTDEGLPQTESQFSLKYFRHNLTILISRSDKFLLSLNISEVHKLVLSKIRLETIGNVRTIVYYCRFWVAFNFQPLTCWLCKLNTDWSVFFVNSVNITRRKLKQRQS